MRPHRDLPAGSQGWAADVDTMRKELDEAKATIKRLSEILRVDPTRPNLNVNPQTISPSANSADQQKLSGMADVKMYNIADGQVLTWDQKEQAVVPKDLPASTGAQWQLATDDEHLWGEVDSDSDYYSTQVMGLWDPALNAGGTGDSYGLVGTSTTSAFLHGRQRYFGGNRKAHGYVFAGPYYAGMGVQWVGDPGHESEGERWASVKCDRERVIISTPTGQSYETATGWVSFQTKWFYVPQFASTARPVPPAGNESAYIGAMIYDLTLQKPIWYSGSNWRDAAGNAV